MSHLALVPSNEPPLSEIALALARDRLGMREGPVAVAQRLGLPPQTLAVLLRNAEFARMLRKYYKELQEDHEGIRLKSAIALEDCIPRMHQLIHDEDTPPTVAVQGFKALAETAGITRADVQTTPGTGFTINIDLSGAAGHKDRVIQVQDD